jgi:hypothetical protein
MKLFDNNAQSKAAYSLIHDSNNALANLDIMIELLKGDGVHETRIAQLRNSHSRLKKCLDDWYLQFKTW